MEMQKALEIAKDSGFDVVSPMDPRKLKFLDAVRDMCAVNKCGQYDKKWVCPPACGSIEKMPERYHRFQDGVIFQTICRLDDEYDFETMGDLAKNHRNAMGKLLDVLSEMDEEIIPFGNDGCDLCDHCAYPDAPCRFPKRSFPSLEACGLMVSEMCKDNGVPYYYGRNTVALTGAFLFNPKLPSAG
jgi:predicted metal-binding protein